MKKKIALGGLTLIEMIATITILGFVAGVTVPMFFATLDIIQYPLSGPNLQESSNMALSRISREIRRLKNESSVITANSALYEFIDVNSTQIRYQLVGNTLMRREGTGSEYGLADQVQTNGLTFTYYDDSGNVIATPLVGTGGTDIRQIEIQLTFQEGSNVRPVSVWVVPRNLPHDADQIP